MSRYNHRKPRQVTGNPKELPIGDHERPKSEIVSKDFVDTFWLGDTDNMPRPTVHRIRKSARSFMEFDNSCQWIKYMKEERPPSPFSSRCSLSSRKSKDNILANDDSESSDKPVGAASATSAADKPAEGGEAWMRDQMSKIQDQQKALQQQQDNLMSLIAQSEHRSLDAGNAREHASENYETSSTGANGVQLFERQGDARRVMSVRGTVQNVDMPHMDLEGDEWAHPLLPGPPVGSQCPNDYLHPVQPPSLRARPALPSPSAHATPATESRSSLAEESNGNFPLGAGEPRKFRRRIKGGRAAAYAQRMEGSAGNLIYNRGPRPAQDDSYATMEDSDNGLRYPLDEEQSLEQDSSQQEIQDVQRNDSHVKEEARLEDHRNPNNIPASFLKGTGVAAGGGNPGSLATRRFSPRGPPMQRQASGGSGGWASQQGVESRAPSAAASATAPAPAAGSARALGRANARRNATPSTDLHDPDSDRAAAGMGSSVPFWERDSKAAPRPASASASHAASHASSRPASSAAASVRPAASGSSVRGVASKTGRSTRTTPSVRSAQPTPSKELGRRSVSPAPAASATAAASATPSTTDTPATVRPTEVSA